MADENNIPPPLLLRRTISVGKHGTDSQIREENI